MRRQYLGVKQKIRVSVDELFGKSLAELLEVQRGVEDLELEVKDKGLGGEDESKLDYWDQMELKFGRMLGEDPKLTLAKIMERKSNPDASYIEIEKSFQKKKGKLNDGIEDLSFDGSNEEGRFSDSLNGLNLVRPVPKKGIKFKSDEKPAVSEIRKPRQSGEKVVDKSTPDVILQKPSTFHEDDIETEKPSSRLQIKHLLEMGKERPKENFSDVTLLKKPEAVRLTANTDLDSLPSVEALDSSSGEAQERSLESAGGFETSSKEKAVDGLKEDTLSSVTGLE